MELPDLKNRGMKIRRLRRLNNLTALNVSQYMGISRGSFNRIELGLRDMRCNEAIMMAELFKVHPNFIMGCESPVITEEHVFKIAIDHGFEVARQVDGKIGISPRLVNFAQAVVTQIHS